MFIKAAINGGRRKEEHPAVPVRPAEIAAAAVAAERAGASAVHFHPRDERGNQSIAGDVVGPAVRAARAAGVTVPVGVTTGLWCCDDDAALRYRLVSEWDDRPDFASVAFSEAGATEAARLVLELGMVLESAVWSMADVPALLASPTLHRNGRVLIEPMVDDAGEAVRAAREMAGAIRQAGYEGPLLYHGEGPTTWPVLDAALADGQQVRIGFEDDLRLPDGTLAESNEELIAAALSRDVRCSTL